MSCGLKNRRTIPQETMKAIRPYVKEIIFSMHGTDPTHDQIVASDPIYQNHPPYWDYVCDSSDNARWEAIPVSFQTVVMKFNYDNLKEMAKFMHLHSHITNEATKWHILRFVKQGRGLENKEQALSDEQLEALPELLESFKTPNMIPYMQGDSNVKITYSNSFDMETCECGSRKAVVTCYGEVIACSALKYMVEKTFSSGKFVCKERL